MKYLTVILFLGLLFTLINPIEMQSQSSTERDTIENRIRNQFNKAVDAAILNSGYQNYFATGASAQIVGTSSTNISSEVYNICLPALKYYKNDTIQVVENRVVVQDYNIARQSIEIITIHTDTSRGIAITGKTPIDKHMILGILWWRDNDSGEWKISSLNRDLWRKRL